ncbi:hypothetical protein BJY04DRAFT_228327 [Aspergillus karnatakaensis]|uniref:uncharacterized protein n=1 Tax=Aspergillus karnatakaensis TaxID=1810916 RepID=UPI003CCE069A
MESLLCQKATFFPNALAVIDGELSLTYAQLLARADHLTRALNNKHILLQEPVCIFLETGHRQIIAQVAVLRAGGSCVPVDPSMPEKRLNDMLSDINARLVITAHELRDRVPGYNLVLFDDTMADSAGVSQNGHIIQVLVDRPADHRSHILFTSGSTGRPKAVQISARSILHLASSTPITPLLPTDRVAEVNNPGFDLSLFEIWVTLLSGATVVVIPKYTATDPFGFRDFVQKHKVSAMILPTALFTIVATTCPSAFKGVRHVIACGEALNVRSVRHVLTEGAPEHLWNGYGPTECTTFVSLQLIDLKETMRETISIGKAVGHTKIYLLDEEMKLIKDADREGEIYLAGPGLSCGYLNQPEANAKHFLELSASALGESSSESVRVFRTGDLARWRIPLEVLDFRGRFDMQVKQDGFRVELGDVERTLEKMDGIRQAVVLQVRPFGEKVLSAFVALSDDGQKLESKAIRDYAKESLPPYMVPSRITIVSRFPLHPYGKVDREALAAASESSENGHNGMPDSNGHWAVPESEVYDTLKRMVRGLIDVPDLGEDEDFFAMGMSSLESARFIGYLMQKFAKKVTMDMLLDNPTVVKIAAVLKESKETRPALVSIAVMEADTLLADDIAVVPDWQAEEEGRVFITGVTGFVGVHLMAQLLALPTVKQVACLARSRKSLSARTRIENTLKRYDIWESSQPHLDKIIVLDGEMADETLGLGDEKFTWLSNWASVIFHVGAKVNFCEPYQNHFPSNVLGTKNVLRLGAVGRRKAFHYMSSIDTWGPTALVLGTKELREDEGLLGHLTSLPYDTGYAHSQWVAEEMVRRMRARGLPVTIYRPGFTIGDRHTAIGNPDDFFARIIVGSIRIGYWPYLPDQRMEYVTVDYVCSALLHIASSNQNLGRSYSLVASDHSQSVNFEETGVMINEAGYHVKEIPYDDWVAKLRASDIDQNPLSPLMPLLEEPVLRELSRLQTSKYTPVYETPNTVKALADRPDIRYTPLSSELLKRYLENWQRKGMYEIYYNGKE